MRLRDLVHSALRADGPLARTIPQYVPRPGQLQMAEEVADTLESGGVLVVEAGTGVGKTYAYLLPTLLGGERTLVSTATKALQDQLFQRDLPDLMALLGVRSRVALLKGRSSYLCLHRLGLARFDAQCNLPGTLRQVADIETWALSTQTGDLAELESLDDNAPVIPLVTSTRDNCLGARCTQAQSCHVNLARREAMAADIVVVNHHLFFADLNIRESGVAELLPTVRTVIFDEAHQLNEIGVQFLGRQLSTSQLSLFAADVAKASLQHARGLAPWDMLLGALGHCVQALRAIGEGTSTRLAWQGEAPHGVSPQRWALTMGGLQASLLAVHDALALLAESSPELAALKERAQYQLESLAAFTQAAVPGGVRWVETGSQLRLVHSPLDIAHAMQSRILAAQVHESAGRSWVFTSATLGHDATLSLFLQSSGLVGARVVQVESPFDYARQAAIYIPAAMPKPGDAAHASAVAGLVARSAARLGGRTLVLTTTLRAMRSIADDLRRHPTLPDGIQVLVQGEASKRELVARFTQGGHDAGRAGYILVASAAFWEGIDIPGEALQLLVIDKLPFSPPADPLQQARAAQLETVGKSAFKELHLPQAAMVLKQGAGRLIRCESDRGVLVVCDVRLNQMGYGKHLLKALPPMRKITDEEALFATLDGFTRASTTDQHSSWFP